LVARSGDNRQRLEQEHHPVVVIAAAARFRCYQASRGLYQPFRELGRRGPIPLGGAVETRAGRLPLRAIIHLAGINMLWRSSERAIRDCIRSALDIAGKRGYRSVAFPLVGAGTGGFAPERALDIMQDEARQIDYDGEVRFVRFRPTA
jgi:O-acetyl-ADP-ribose deacetylase (regulator of RNase III)